MLHKTVAFRTIGCRLNQCETAQMQEDLLGAGFSLVDWDAPADIRVINTCTVTAKSDRTCRHEIHRAKRADPACLMVLVGCLAQVAPERAAAITGVDVVLGNLDKLRLSEHLLSLGGADTAPQTGPATAAAADRHETPARAGEEGPLVRVTPYPDRLDFEARSFTHFLGYTRAFLKIQSGCDSHCAYCIIPAARGPARSMPAPAVLQQVRLLAGQGYREVVLTGIDLGRWGRDTGEGSLADLLALLLGDSAAAAVGRYRLSSIEPFQVDHGLLDVIHQAGDRVAHHFHLPLQSGSDAVLSRMARPYTAAQYLDVAGECARCFPDAALGADVIVGFPGETDAEFEETLALIEASPLTHLHVFAYSDRPGTRASTMTGKVPPDIIRERSERTRRLRAFKNESFRGRLAGTEQRVLVLKERSTDGRLVGLTGNYLEALVGDDENLVNTFARVRLDRPLPDGRFEATLTAREVPCA